jgi:hypothetical protein
VKLGIQSVNRLFQKRDLRCLNTQALDSTVVGFGTAKVGTEIEEVVLHSLQRVGLGGLGALGGNGEYEQSQDRIEFVNTAVRFDARIILGHSRPVPESGVPVIAGLRIDA